VRRYFFTSLCLIGFGLVSSGLVEIYFRYRESWDSFGAVQKEVTASATAKIEQFIDEIERAIKAATRTREIVEQGLSPEYHWELRRLLVNVPAITEATAFDLSGARRATASRTEAVAVEADLTPLNPQGLEVSRLRLSYFGPVHFPDALGPAMTLTVPVERFPGEVIGVIQAEIDLTQVRDVIANVRVGTGGHAFLVTRAGQLIAHSDVKLAFPSRDFAQVEQVKAAMDDIAAGSPVRSSIRRNILGDKVFTHYGLSPRLNWIVFTEQPAAEVYGPLYRSLMQTSVMLLVGLALALYATYRLRFRVVRPLETLRSQVERIKEGDLSARVDLVTGDEIEDLAREFNDMAAHLKKAQSNLEQRVVERTEELSTANRKLQEASEHKSQFLANVNHELRTPAIAVIGYGHLILQATEGQIAPLQRDNLVDLLHNARKLLDLIDSLLDLARIEAGKIEVLAEPTNIAEVISSATATVEPLLIKDLVHIVSDVELDMPTFSTDRGKLSQIILNLLVNAVKFTERGEIKIRAVQRNGSISLSVSDTGLGIAKEDLDRIFDEFHRGQMQSDKTLPGTGLGLAIVKKLTEVLGGVVTVESKVGIGSTFTVSVPLTHRVPDCSNPMEHHG
jgi:signal transduction histidine kinase